MTPSSRHMPLVTLSSQVEVVSELDIEREQRLAVLRRESSHRAVMQYTVKSAVATFVLFAERNVPAGGMLVQQFSLSELCFERCFERRNGVGSRTGILKLAMQHDLLQGLDTTLYVHHFLVQPMLRAVELTALHDLVDTAFHPDSPVMRIELNEQLQRDFTLRSWMSWEESCHVQYDCVRRCYYITRPHDLPPVLPPTLERQDAMNF